MENEVSVIAHLLEVEKQSSALVDEAQVEGNKRILRCKSQAEEKFYTTYHDMDHQMEVEYNKNLDSLNKEHREQIDAYKQQILAMPKDAQAFNSFMNKTLFAN